MQRTCFSRVVVVFWTGEHHMCGNFLHSLEWGYILVFPDISANSFGRRDLADAGKQTATQNELSRRAQKDIDKGVIYGTEWGSICMTM